MNEKLSTCLLATVFGAVFGCGSSPEPKPREPRALEPLSETAKIRETKSFEEPALTPASRELTDKEQKKPKSTPETESAPPTEQPKTKQAHPMSDETWGTVPWGDGPWGE